MMGKLSTKPTPVIGSMAADLSFDDAMLIKLQKQSVTLPDDGSEIGIFVLDDIGQWLKQIGDTIVLECSGHATTAGSALNLNVNFDDGYDDPNPFNKTFSIGAGHIWSMRVVLTLIGNDQIKSHVVYTYSQTGGFEILEGYDDQYVHLSISAVAINFVGSIDSSGVGYTIDIGKAYLIKNANGLPNFGTPANAAYSTPGGDGGNLTWAWNNADYLDPEKWIAQVQLANGTWSDCVGGGVSGTGPVNGNLRSIGIDGAGLSDDFPTWNGKIRVIGWTQGQAVYLTNPSAAVNTGLV